MKFLYFTYVLLIVLSIAIVAGLVASGNWIWLIAAVVVVGSLMVARPIVGRHA